MSGISADRAYKIRSRLKSRLADIISSGVSFHSTIDTITDNVRKMVWEDKDLKRCPERVRSYLRGYYDAKWDEMWNKHFVWLLWCDGQLMTNKEVDALTDKERREGANPRDPNYKSPWSRIDSDKSRHVWKGKDGEPLRDKPIDQKWREPNAGT